MLKKFVIILVLLSFICLAMPSLTQATMGESLNKTAEQAEISQDQNLTSFIAAVVNGLMALLGLVFLILIIYGGVQWMTAMGQEEKIKKAKKTIINSVIGLLIIIISYAFVSYIIYLLDLWDIMYYW